MRDEDKSNAIITLLQDALTLPPGFQILSAIPCFLIFFLIPQPSALIPSDSGSVRSSSIAAASSASRAMTP